MPVIGPAPAGHGRDEDSPCGLPVGGARPLPGAPWAPGCRVGDDAVQACSQDEGSDQVNDGTSDPHREYEEGSGQQNGIDISRIHLPEFFPDVETIRSDIADYYWEVQRWDHDVAAAIRLLEEAGELDNTIIVMTGDNGIPFPRCKANLYDWGARVPLAIRWPASL